MLKSTIVAPDGMEKTNESHSPNNTEVCENNIDIKTVLLKLLPTFIAAATGMIIKLETSNTPTVSMESETTSARVMVEKN